MGFRSSHFWISRLGGWLGVWAVLCLAAWWLGRRAPGEGFTAAPPPAQQIVGGVDEGQSPPASLDGADAVERAWRELQELGEPPASGAIGQFVESGLIARILESLSENQKWEMFHKRKLLRKIVEHPEKLPAGLFAKLLDVLSKTDPELAFEICLELSRREDAPYAPDMDRIFRALANRHPRAAFEQWRQGQADSGPGKWKETGMLRVIFNHWQMRDLDEALAAADRLQSEEERRQAARGLVGGLYHLFRGEPEAWKSEAIPLARQLLSHAEEDSAYIGVVSRVAGNISASSPGVLKRWFRELQVAPEHVAWMTKAVAAGWAERLVGQLQHDPSPVWDWLVEELPASERASALAYVVRSWCETEETNTINMTYQQPRPPDLASCSEWLISYGLGPESQEAMAVLATAWGQHYEPEAALAWARAITDEASRQAAEAAVEAELKKRFPTGWEVVPAPPE